MAASKYVCLRNPHAWEWLVFENTGEYYAPNAGCPISNGKTPEEAIRMAYDFFGIIPEDVEVH